MYPSIYFFAAGLKDMDNDMALPLPMISSPRAKSKNLIAKRKYIAKSKENTHSPLLMQLVMFLVANVSRTW